MERVSIGTSGWCGLSTRDFARRFDVVEFNWTFHERGSSVEQFRQTAHDLQALGIQAVLKVSGLATHERRLRSPEAWWPGLWAKYEQLHDAGVLGALLWQLAPSHHYTPQALAELEALAAQLPRAVLHVFEFRHSSWYGRPLVLQALQRHRLCLAWIHIANEDGWCGDLESGWPCKDQTCEALYLRMFGTKSKAVGRYTEEFLRHEVLPHLERPGLPEEAFVVFAQADVPDHAKADAAATTDLLGRTHPSAASRSTRWEREVVAATLGLAVGVAVEGVIRRISHRTAFIDVGRCCQAKLCLHHARRVGLLERLHIGTSLAGLVVEDMDFEGEWAIVGLTCHRAVVTALGDASAPSRRQAPRRDPALRLSDAEVLLKSNMGQNRRCRWHAAPVRKAEAAPPGAHQAELMSQVSSSDCSSSQLQAIAELRATDGEAEPAVGAEDAPKLPGRRWGAYMGTATPTTRSGASSDVEEFGCSELSADYSRERAKSGRNKISSLPRDEDSEP
mmetsp:Transcript_100244/g.283883  ORF Transcript_100244/g.283883 Transcript_100244/m.283883 type:complete len:505 (+) Transcript_100244:77-1591(+)